MLNSTWAGDEIKIHKDINISIAVASEDKLYVPVIKMLMINQSKVSLVKLMILQLEEGSIN